MDLSHLSSNDWQTAIKESWLLVETQAEQTRLKQIVQSGDFIYFTDSHRGKRPQMGADALLRQSHIHFVTAHCFYQESQQAPASEICFVIPNAHQVKTDKLWHEFIRQFKQEAFVMSHKEKSSLWIYNKDEKQFILDKTIALPKIHTWKDIQP